ncbi:radical SAM protein [Candidatus Woesearchaeota archaeon]|nr:radical SAM protein [Candidatus Woesearchaeota archaeon]
MKKTDIILGYRCNNNCIFCSTAHFPKTQVAKEKIKQQILESKKNKADEICFTGGEPTIRKDIIEIVSFAGRQNFKQIYIDSNGRLFYYKKFCEKIINAGATSFLIPFYAADRETFKLITGSEHAYEQTLEGIKNLINLNQKVDVNIVLVKQNITQLSKIVNLLLNYKVKNILFWGCCPINNPKFNFKKIIPNPKDAAYYLNKTLDSYEQKISHISINGIPPCKIKKYDKYFVWKYTYMSVLLGHNWKIDDLEKQKLDNSIKGKICSSCKRVETCPGIWKEYFKYYHEEEFELMPY